MHVYCWTKSDSAWHMSQHQIAGFLGRRLCLRPGVLKLSKRLSCVGCWLRSCWILTWNSCSSIREGSGHTDWQYFKSNLRPGQPVALRLAEQRTECSDVAQEKDCEKLEGIRMPSANCHGAYSQCGHCLGDAAEKARLGNVVQGKRTMLHL